MGTLHHPTLLPTLLLPDLQHSHRPLPQPPRLRLEHRDRTSTPQSGAVCGKAQTQVLCPDALRLHGQAILRLQQDAALKEISDGESVCMCVRV